MKLSKIILFALFVLQVNTSYEQQKNSTDIPDSVAALKDKLIELSSLSSNTYFIDHCQSFLAVINAKTTLTHTDTVFLSTTYAVFTDSISAGDPSELNSYLNRQRPFILSWISPTDSATSFSWLKLPKDWNPDLEYPLYIELHGLWGVADNPIEYLSYPYRQDAGDNFAFEDGYLLSPWGRGNLWYKGISETDIWECMAALAQIVHIDSTRKYLTGHSMGGFGAWYIGLRSADTWAALGIHAGALWYDNNVMMPDVFQTLKDMPVYFVVGTSDGLYSINQTAYQNLQSAGNIQIKFVTFNGGHEYLEENVQNMYLWLRNFTKDDINTGINNIFPAEKEDGILNCYPNPLRNEGSISYRVYSPSELKICLYDVYGRIVKSFDLGYKQSGEYTISINVSELANGLYLGQLQMSNQSHLFKIIIRR